MDLWWKVILVAVGALWLILGFYFVIYNSHLRDELRHRQSRLEARERELQKEMDALASRSRRDEVQPKAPAVHPVTAGGPLQGSEDGGTEYSDGFAAGYAEGYGDGLRDAEEEAGEVIEAERKIAWAEGYEKGFGDAL